MSDFAGFAEMRELHGAGERPLSCVEIARALREEILAGKYRPLQGFPSSEMLSRRFGVTRVMARRALETLCHEGLLTSQRGRGTFVTQTGGSRQIGLIIPGIAYSAFFGPIISEINRLARQERYGLRFGEVFSTDIAARIREVRELAAEFVRNRVAGVLYQPLEGDAGVLALNRHILFVFARAKIPVVLLDGDVAPLPDCSEHDVVGIDDMEAGFRLGEHLVSAGARRVHFLFHPPTASCDPPDRRRLYGLAASLVQQGLPFDRSRSVLQAAPDDVDALRRHLRRGRPDAFVCSNDSAAALFLRTLSSAGVRVPSDMMLAGFGGLPVSRILMPPLTTVLQPCDEIARTAFRRLLARIADPLLPPIRLSLPAPLVVRDSTVKRALTTKWKRT